MGPKRWMPIAVACLATLAVLGARHRWPPGAAPPARSAASPAPQTPDPSAALGGWCAYSLALGHPHRPMGRVLLVHGGVAYRLCGGSCAAAWRRFGRLVRADAQRAWRRVSLGL